MSLPSTKNSLLSLQESTLLVETTREWMSLLLNVPMPAQIVHVHSYFTFYFDLLECLAFTINKANTIGCYFKQTITTPTTSVALTLRDTYLNPRARPRNYATFNNFNGVSTLIIGLSAITAGDCGTVCDNISSTFYRRVD